MTQLAAGIVEARNDLAAEDDTAAHTRAEGNHDGIGGTLGGTRDGLAPSGGVGIVLHEDLLYGEACLDGLADVALVQGGDVAAVFDNAIIMVGDAGGGDAHRLDLGGVNACLLTDGVADGGHVGGDLGGGALGTRGDAGLADDLKLLIDDTRGDVGAAQVDTDAIHSVVSVFCRFSA